MSELFTPKPFVLPRRVQVGPYWYGMRRDPGVDAGDRSGETNHHPVREIVFGVNVQPQEMPAIWIHELVHVVAAVYEVGGLRGKEGCSEDVERLANGLTQALQSAGLLPERAVLEGDDASQE